MFEVAAQDNIGTAAGHVGGNGNCADFTGLSYNQCLALVFFSVSERYVVDLLYVISQKPVRSFRCWLYRPKPVGRFCGDSAMSFDDGFKFFFG